MQSFEMQIRRVSVVSLDLRLQYYFPFALLFIHFVIFDVAGFSFTPAFFLVLLVILNCARRMRTPMHWAFLLLLAGYPIWVLSVYSLMGGRADLDDFIRTYSLWLVSVSAIFTVSTCAAQPVTSIPFKGIVVSAALLFAYSLLQVITFLFLGSDVFYTPFGDRMYFGGYDVWRHAYAAIPRASGLYLEPSFNAFIFVSLLCGALLHPDGTGNGRALAILSTVGGVMLTQSAIGLIALIGLLGLQSVLWLSGKSTASRLLILVVSPLLFFALAEFFLDYRLDELATAGTSMYWRLVAPLIVLDGVFDEAMLGVPLGQVEAIVGAFGLSHGSGVGTSIDNGLYLIVFYFGLVGALGIIILFLFLVFSYLVGHVRKALLGWFLISSLMFSGGLFLPEYIIAVAFVVLVFRLPRRGAGQLS